MPLHVPTLTNVNRLRQSAKSAYLLRLHRAQRMFKQLPHRRSPNPHNADMSGSGEPRREMLD
jgi:hypothetical protein